MKSKWFQRAIPILAVAALGTSGCNRAENPREVRQDVNEAQQERREEVAEARRDDGAQSREVAMARIEGDRKVAKERCEALEGDAQSTCKQQADMTFEEEKQRIERAYN